MSPALMAWSLRVAWLSDVIGAASLVRISNRVIRLKAIDKACMVARRETKEVE